MLSHQNFKNPRGIAFSGNRHADLSGSPLPADSIQLQGNPEMKARAPWPRQYPCPKLWPAPGWDQIPWEFQQGLSRGFCVSIIKPGFRLSRKNARCGQTQEIKIIVGGSSAIRRYSRPTPSLWRFRLGIAKRLAKANPNLFRDQIHAFMAPHPGNAGRYAVFSTWILVFIFHQEWLAPCG